MLSNCKKTHDIFSQKASHLFRPKMAIEMSHTLPAVFFFFVILVSENFTQFESKEFIVALD